MRQLLLATFAFAMLTNVVAAQQKPLKQEVDGKIKWVYNYDVGKLLSQTENKPMFVVFRCER